MPIGPWHCPPPRANGHTALGISIPRSTQPNGKLHRVQAIRNQKHFGSKAAAQPGDLKIPFPKVGKKSGVVIAKLAQDNGQITFVVLYYQFRTIHLQIKTMSKHATGKCFGVDRLLKILPPANEIYF